MKRGYGTTILVDPDNHATTQGIVLDQDYLRDVLGVMYCLQDCLPLLLFLFYITISLANSRPSLTQNLQKLDHAVPYTKSTCKNTY